MGYKEEFINIYNENIKRSGSKELLDWMMKTDFFTAPASSKFHCACEQGLVMHSLSVYHTLVEKHFEPDKDSPESGMYYLFLCVLSCTERFTEALVSVFLIERFMRLKTSEAMAIRWHMGGFDDAAKGGGFSIALAYEKYPLAVKLHLADLESTYLREKNTSVIDK